MRKKTNKKLGKVQKEEVVKVQIVEPEPVKIAPETFKRESVASKPILLPAEPAPEPIFSPNEPAMVGTDTGFKRPSIANLKMAYTKEQYKSLMKAYQKQNPEKYELKKGRLETKLKELK